MLERRSLEDWQELGFVLPTFFISSAPSLDILEYYMEQADLDISNSFEFILLDDKGLVTKLNPYLDNVLSSIYILFLDRNNTIMESGNPFIDKNIMSNCRKLNNEIRNNYQVQAIRQEKGIEDPEVLDIIDENTPSLILINGKERSLNRLKKVLNNIVSWSYTVGPTAEILYGERGKNGVLVVTIKQ